MFRGILLKSITPLSLGLALLAALFTLPGTSARAHPALSDFVGVYALIDRVVLEPNDTAPERVQVWGAFALANTEDRNTYESPRRGYFYYSLQPGKEDVC